MYYYKELQFYSLNRAPAKTQIPASRTELFHLLLYLDPPDRGGVPDTAPSLYVLTRGMKDYMQGILGRYPPPSSTAFRETTLLLVPGAPRKSDTSRRFFQCQPFREGGGGVSNTLTKLNPKQKMIMGAPQNESQPIHYRTHRGKSTPGPFSS